MKNHKKKNKFIHKNYNIIFYITIFINIIVIGLCSYTYKLYSNELKLNIKLNSIKEEYISINNSIKDYTSIKEDIDLVNGESSSINDKYSKINEEIESKKNTVDSFNNKIYDLNNKIKKLS